MTHYIRTKDNKTIVDLEASKDDFHVVVDIENYTRKLLSLPEDLMGQFMYEMSDMQELRGSWFEVLEPRGNFKMVDYISRIFKGVAEDWDLSYITD